MLPPVQLHPIDLEQQTPEYIDVEFDAQQPATTEQPQGLALTFTAPQGF